METYFFPSHVILLSAGFLSILVGISVARFARKEKWWLKAHRGLVTGGAVSMATGVAAAAAMVGASGGPHFREGHAFLGAAALISPFVVAGIGIAMLKPPPSPAAGHNAASEKEKAREKAKAMRRVHRIAGRTAAVLMALTAASGVLTALGF